MPKVVLKVITHKLNVNPKYKIVWQKKRNFAFERPKAINEEVDKLPTIQFIHEAHYPNWLTNVVMITKANRKWWIYINYADLNKVCLKDSFPLLMIHQLVDGY